MEALSTREFEINAELAKGYLVKEIADRLFISPYTVDTHIKNIKKKTGARNIADLTRIFILSLDHPKQFFKTSVSVLFLAIQIFISIDNPDIDLRRSSRTRTIFRASRTIRKA